MILKRQKKYKSFKHQVISLGYNCMGRTIPTKYGIKPTKIYGEKTIVTDQIFSPSIKQLIHLWNTNFRDFMDGLYYSEEKNAWILPKYETCAPHEFQLSEKKFRKTVEKRIKNFYEVINTEKYAIFIRFQNEDFDVENVKLLNNKIKEVRVDKPYHIFIINHSQPANNVNVENVTVINCPMTLSSKWTNELQTEEGKKFCATFMEPIMNLINSL